MDYRKNIIYFNFAFFLRAMLLLQPIMLLFYQWNGLTVKDFFFFQGVFYLSSIILEIPVGYISDIISKKKLIIVSFIIYLGISILWLFSHGYYIVLAGEVCFALSKVIMDNTMSGYLSDYLNSNNQSNLMTQYYGKLNFYLSMGTTVAALIGTWLYKYYGIKVILITEILVLALAIFLMNKLPNFEHISVKDFTKHLKQYYVNVKTVFFNPKLKYYILYSGLLTSFSILFAMSFQPLMQNALCPIALFGIITCANHFVRAISGIFAGKLKFNIKKLILPLYILYILGFAFIFIVLHCKNVAIVALLLFLICIIIGVQLIFTIMHVSRLHKFVSADKRGCGMAVNNIISRTLSAFCLLSSKIFIDKAGLSLFFTVMLIIFLISSSLTVLKLFKQKEEF